MKFRAIPILLSAALWSSSGLAGGYVKNSGGEIVRSAYGECWHSGSWRTAMTVPGCDGLDVVPVAAIVAEPIAVAIIDPVKPVLTTTPVQFGFDSAQLSTKEMGKLDVMIGAVRTLTGAGTLNLVGHADRIGPEDYNMALSERRAQAVRDYLAQRMHSGVIFRVSGKGESMPAVACDGESGAGLISCLAPNRRVGIEARLDGGP